VPKAHPNETVSREFSLGEFTARDPLSFSHVVPGGFSSAKGDKGGLNAREIDERSGYASPLRGD